MGINKIKPIYNNLTKYWTDFVNPIAFWQHEYDKHLTCAKDVYPDPYILFYYGLQLREKYDIYNTLLNNNIYPSNEIKYNIQQIYDSIKQKYNVNTVATCINTTILNQIIFCMTKNLTLY